MAGNTNIFSRNYVNRNIKGIKGGLPLMNYDKSDLSQFMWFLPETFYAPKYYRVSCLKKFRIMYNTNGLVNLIKKYYWGNYLYARR